MNTSPARSHRPQALVACELPAEALDVLARYCDVEVLPEPGRPEPDRVAAAAAGKEAVVFSVTLKMNAELVAALPPSVRAVATYSVGLDHVDLAACEERGLQVFNTPDVLTDAVAEIGLLLMLGAARRAREAAALILERRWRGWQPTQLNGVELSGKTLGVFGMGRIGQAIAERARAFGMAIHYTNRSRLPADREDGAVFHADPDDLLAVSDVLVLACPATPQTRRFLNKDRLSHLKHGAIVVNVSRGNVIDDEALIAGLSDGRVYAAGLDVFDNEPDLDERYYDLPNVFMLPHIGSSTIETRMKMAQLLGEAISAGR